MFYTNMDPLPHDAPVDLQGDWCHDTTACTQGGHILPVQVVAHPLCMSVSVLGYNKSITSASYHPRPSKQK